MPNEIPPGCGGHGLGQCNAHARGLGAAELHSITQPLLAKEHCCRWAGEEGQPFANPSISLALPGRDCMPRSAYRAGLGVLQLAVSCHKPFL